MRCEDLPLSGSYANFEGYFSEEYFRASVIDGMTRAILEFFFFFVILKSNARCVYFRLEQTLAIAYLCTGARQLFLSFFGDYFEIGSGHRAVPSTWLTGVSREIVLLRLPGIPLDGRHEGTWTKCRVYFFLFFFSNRTSSSVPSKRLIIRRKQTITKSIVCIDTRWITIDAPSWKSRKINVRHQNVSY